MPIAAQDNKALEKPAYLGRAISFYAEGGGNVYTATTSHDFDVIDANNNGTLPNHE